MAKAVRLNFSKVEERSSWNTRHISEGLHEMKIEGVQITEAQDDTPMWVYALVPTNPKFKTRRFPYYCKLQDNQLWKLRDLFVAAGISVPKKAVSIDPEKPVGKTIAAEVADDEYQGNIRSSVQGTYSLDILEDDEASTGSDEEDEEEYEDDPEEEDYEDDEEEEDLSTLTLAELRKLAKSLGIDTDGVKKADLIEMIEEEQEADDEDEDEDDLGDEDLDDEDLDDEEFEDDDEEEEEAPAPKRRSASTKKSPAKPARRTVKRR